MAELSSPASALWAAPKLFTELSPCHQPDPHLVFPQEMLWHRNSDSLQYFLGNAQQLGAEGWLSTVGAAQPQVLSVFPPAFPALFVMQTCFLLHPRLAAIWITGLLSPFFVIVLEFTDNWLTIKWRFQLEFFLSVTGAGSAMHSSDGSTDIRHRNKNFPDILQVPGYVNLEPSSHAKYTQGPSKGW